MHNTLKHEHPELYQTLNPAQRHVLSPAKTWNVQLQHAGSGRTAVRPSVRRTAMRFASQPPQTCLKSRATFIRARKRLILNHEIKAQTASKHRP